MKLLTKLSLLFGVVLLSVTSAIKYGPFGPLKIYSIEECDPPVNLIDFKAEILQTSDDSDCLQVSFELIEDIDQSTKLNVHAFECDPRGENCKKDVFISEDKSLIALFVHFFPTITQQLIKSIIPPIPENGKVPAGPYVLECFQASYKDVSLAYMSYGFYYFEATWKQDDVTLVCFRGKVESFPPPLLQF